MFLHVLAMNVLPVSWSGRRFFSPQTGLPEDFAQMWVLVYYSESDHLGDVLRTVEYDGIPNLTCSGPAACYSGGGCWYFTNTFYNKVLGVVLCLWCLPVHRAGMVHFELNPNYSVTCDSGRWDLKIPGVLHRPLFLKWLHWLQNNIIYFNACKLVGYNKQSFWELAVTPLKVWLHNSERWAKSTLKHLVLPFPLWHPVRAKLILYVLFFLFC